MTDVEALKRLMKENGKSQAELSAELGISNQRLANKLNNREEFRASEIQKLIRIFNMNARQTDYIFFEE